MHHLWWEINTL